MADIFLSYSSNDRAIAMQVQAALEAAGFPVFWDQETPAGWDWNSWIGEKLGQARVVIVLWSKTSVKSRNVVHEATIAVERKLLVPAIVEDLKSTDFPMGFYTVQAADLRGFRGQAGHAGMGKLIAAVEARLGRRAAGAPVSLQDARPKSAPPWPLIGGGVALVAIAAAVLTGVVPLGPQAGSGGAREAAITEDPVYAVLGRWRWDGLACGAGPEVARSGDLLTFTMADTPTFTHAVEKAEAGVLHTIVVEPEAFRGAQYALTRQGDTLEVQTVADGKVDTWQACP